MGKRRSDLFTGWWLSSSHNVLGSLSCFRCYHRVVQIGKKSEPYKIKMGASILVKFNESVVYFVDIFGQISKKKNRS